MIVCIKSIKNKLEEIFEKEVDDLRLRLIYLYKSLGQQPNVTDLLKTEQ